MTHRSTLGRTSLIALALLLPMSAAGAPTPVASIRPPTTTRPPILMIPEFDLAIVGGDTKLEQRDPAKSSGITAAFTVTLKNLGSKAITKQNVGCQLGKVQLVNFGITTVLQPGEVRKVVVTTKTDWLEIPEGNQSIRCVATIAEPLRVQDANAANNRWTKSIMARPHVAPVTDLVPSAAALRDCATHSTATNVADACVEVEYQNNGASLASDYYIECSVERTYPIAQPATTTRIAATLPTAANAGAKASLNVGKLALGQYHANCTLDRTSAVPETNENNNTVATTATIAAPEYDVAILTVDDKMRAADTGSAQAKFDVVLANNGTKAITRASVACVFGPANEKLPLAKTSATVNGHSNVTVTVSLPTYPKYKGNQPLRCSASIVSPTGVADQAMQNNAWTGTIWVP